MFQYLVLKKVNICIASSLLIRTARTRRNYVALFSTNSANMAENCID